MGDDVNLSGWRLWKEARHLVQEIFRYIPDVKANSVYIQMRRAALQLLCSVSESRLAVSRRQAIVLLDDALQICAELRHMLRIYRCYRYIPNEVSRELDTLCQKLYPTLEQEIQRLSMGFGRLYPEKPEEKGTEDSDLVKGKE